MVCGKVNAGWHTGRISFSILFLRLLVGRWWDKPARRGLKARQKSRHPHFYNRVRLFLASLLPRRIHDHAMQDIMLACREGI